MSLYDEVEFIIRTKKEQTLDVLLAFLSKQECFNPYGILYLACEYGTVHIVDFLIKSFNIDVDELCHICAAKRGKLDIVKYLIKGNNIPSMDEAIISAAHNGHINVVELLLSHSSSSQEISDEAKKIALYNANAKKQTRKYHGLINT